MSVITMRPRLSRLEIQQACRHASDMDRQQLLRVAVARGCRHYAAFSGDKAEACADDPELPHEVLGVALLRGNRNVDTFQAIRCGAMVLSDLRNHLAVIEDAARQFKVVDRVAHIARLAMAGDTHPERWAALAELGVVDEAEAAFLPGLSRFSIETHHCADGAWRFLRIWLRTDWP